MFKRVKFHNMGTNKVAYISRRHVSALVEGEMQNTTTVHFAGGWLVVGGSLVEVGKMLGIKIKEKR